MPKNKANRIMISSFGEGLFKPIFKILYTPPNDTVEQFGIIMAHIDSVGKKYDNAC
jgi:hypothetical protein